jgi:hypothetical protein
MRSESTRILRESHADATGVLRVIKSEGADAG